MANIVARDLHQGVRPSAEIHYDRYSYIESCDTDLSYRAIEQNATFLIYVPTLSCRVDFTIIWRKSVREVFRPFYRRVQSIANVTFWIYFFIST